ncbi:winged helix-turn-helix transcriptional regulator [Methylobacterium sp. JK268]
MHLIGGRWRMLIVLSLSGGPRRFGQIAREIPGLSKRILTSELRILEENALVVRGTFAEMPVRVEYSLSIQGEGLQPILAALETFGLSLREYRAMTKGQEPHGVEVDEMTA